MFWCSDFGVSPAQRATRMVAERFQRCPSNARGPWPGDSTLAAAPGRPAPFIKRPAAHFREIPMVGAICHTVRFGPVGRVSRLPALILGSQDQAGRVREDGPEGGIGRQGSGKGPGRPNLTFSTIFEPDRAVSSPWRDSLLRPAALPRTFIFLRNFTIPASEPSNSVQISLFCCFQGHRLQRYPHQTLENLQAHPYCKKSRP